MRKKTISCYALLIMILTSMPVQAKEWAFTVLLDGKEIGYHKFTYNETQHELKSEARFNVKILFVTAYRYVHDAQETWQGDCLVKLKAVTEDGGVKSWVNGAMQDSQFVVETAKGKKPVGSCPMTFAYWNPAILQQTMLLNPQNGDWLETKIQSLGDETIQVKGQSTLSHHYLLEAPKFHIDLWYSQGNEWLGLKSTTPEGRVITYQLR